MSRRVMEAEARITATDRTGRVFDQVARKMDRATRAGQAMSRASLVAAKAQRAEASLMAGTARMVGGVLAVDTARRAVVAYADLDRQMSRIAITADASSAEQVEALGKVRQIADDVGLPLQDVIGGLDKLVTQGYSLKESLDFLPSVAISAQGAGAAVSDIADTAEAVSKQFGIAASSMQGAFDIMAAGGKAGKFELRDMAQYLPSIAPAAAAVGLKGAAGLRQLVAMLQVVRVQTGSAGEAATSVQNIFAKMESEATAKKFKDFGVDLRKEMAKARKDGRNLLDVFVELSERALKGDLSKIPQLFTDMEFQRGMRAILSQKGAVGELAKELENVDGASLRDMSRVAEDARASIDRLSNSWDHLLASTGRLADSGGGTRLMTEIGDEVSTIADYLDKTSESAKEKGLGNTLLYEVLPDAWDMFSAGGFSRPASEAPAAALAPYEDTVRSIEEKLAAIEADASLSERSKRSRRVTLNSDLERARADRDQYASVLAEQDDKRNASARSVAGFYNQLPLDTAGDWTTGRQAAAGREGLSFGSLADILGAGQIVAEVKEPVQLDPNSKADVNVTIRVEPGSALIRAIEQARSVSSSGNVQANVGVSMPEVSGN